MTPKEKALSLIEKYETLVVMWTGGVEVERQNVKQCALITVEEILKEIEDNCMEYDDDFWEQVKIEINKL